MKTKVKWEKAQDSLSTKKIRYKKHEIREKLIIKKAYLIACKPDIIEKACKQLKLK